MKSLLSAKLLKGVSEVSASSLESNLVLLYFSASWCPPCRQFTPLLVDFYNKVNAQHKAAEIILVSADRTQEDFQKYFEKMPWLAVPFEEETIRASLAQKCQVTTIPNLSLMDSQGNPVKEVRYDVAEKPNEALDLWKQALSK